MSVCTLSFYFSFSRRSSLAIWPGSSETRKLSVRRPALLVKKKYLIFKNFIILINTLALACNSIVNSVGALQSVQRCWAGGSYGSPAWIRRKGSQADTDGVFFYVSASRASGGILYYSRTVHSASR